MNNKKMSSREIIYNFYKKYTEEKGFPPSYSEVKKATNLKSASTIHFHVQKLIEEGRLVKNQSRISVPFEQLSSQEENYIPLFIISNGKIVSKGRVPYFACFGRGTLFAFQLQSRIESQNTEPGDYFILKKITETDTDKEKLVVNLLTEEFFVSTRPTLIQNYSPHSFKILGVVDALIRFSPRK